MNHIVNCEYHIKSRHLEVSNDSNQTTIDKCFESRHSLVLALFDLL